jgi:hypothetical protein
MYYTYSFFSMFAFCLSDALLVNDACQALEHSNISSWIIDLWYFFGLI